MGNSLSGNRRVCQLGQRPDGEEDVGVVAAVAAGNGQSEVGSARGATELGPGQVLQLYMRQAQAEFGEGRGIGSFVRLHHVRCFDSNRADHDVKNLRDGQTVSGEI